MPEFRAGQGVSKARWHHRTVLLLFLDPIQTQPDLPGLQHVLKHEFVARFSDHQNGSSTNVSCYLSENTMALDRGHTIRETAASS